MEPERLDPSSLLSDLIKSVYEDRHGQIWVGLTGGLSRFEPASESFVRYRLGDELEPTVTTILEDHGGTLWLGSDAAGLFYLEAGATLSEGEANATQSPNRGANATPSRDWAYLRHDPEDDHSLSSNSIVTLFEDRSGNLWIGTGGAGLDRLDSKRERFSHYREQDGLASNEILGILEDDAGHLWLSTSRGLSRLEPRTGPSHNFGTEDGLQSNVFSHDSAFRNPRGEMFFGGTHGFNAFFPDQIRTDPFIPPVVLTDFQLLNESLPLRRIDPESPLEHSFLETSEIRLSHRHNVFSLEFAALHYANPQKNRYAYRLEGFDSGWTTTDAGRRLATYTNLDAGSYLFRVRGGNPDGVWNEEEASVQIVVAPPPWESWWAYMLYTLAVSAMILGAIRSQKHKLERERAASQQLRQVDKLKDEFLANTSHELRTPLYGIIGLAESLIDGATGELPEETKANLAMIVGSGRRLGRLVGDILDYSQLTHRSLALHRRPIDLHSLAEVVLTLQRPLAASKNLKLQNAVPADLPAADADEARLEQILHNLVGNAVKFTEEGKIEISAVVEEGLRPSEGGQATRPLAGASQLVITVEDTGIGVAADQRQRIFEAFEQADSGTQRMFGGTGLGLTVTRELVELHSGRIWVESTGEQGSRFSFTMPISDQDAEPAASSGEPLSRLLPVEPVLPLPPPGEDTDPALSPTRRNPRAERILVVDDEPVNLRVLSNHLASAGYPVALASSGPQALRLVDEQAFDLVVLDVMMPKMSGYEVCRVLRERHALGELPVIFLTAKDRVPDLVAGLSAGGNDYLAKPIAKDELLARVRTHLELLTVNRNLEARNAELARFNYTVSHDLKNPLVTIKNFLGLVRRDATSGRTERLEGDLDRLDAAAQKLQRLLDELFELSRVGIQANTPEELALGEMVRQALEALAEPIAESGVQIEVAEDLPIVCGDHARLLEAVRHLLANAVHYLGDPPTPLIEVGMRHPGRQAGEPMIFYVRDNGVGIDPKYHEKVFGLFERLAPEESEGTGIGLALVKRIVEVHGGRIWVESAGRGHGSTFCFTLPAAGPSTTGALAKGARPA